MMASAANANANGNGNVIDVDDSNFEAEVLTAELPVLVEFGAQWCGPCKVLAPIVRRLADETVGRVKVVMVDLDASPRTAERYGVRGVPTVLVFRGGGRPRSTWGRRARSG